MEGAQRRCQLIADLAQRENLTVRQLIGRLGGGRGHRTFAGTPEQVAATIGEWFDTGAADGFNIMPAALPAGLEVFVGRAGARCLTISLTCMPLLAPRTGSIGPGVSRTGRDHAGHSPRRADRPSS